MSSSGCGKSGCSEEHEHFHDIGGGVPLYAFIDKSKVYCLNERLVDSGKSIIKPYELRNTMTPELLSDEDDVELLISIPFTAAVRLRCISLNSFNDGTSPSKLRFFVNKPSLDFQSIADMKPVQELLLPEVDGGGIIDWPLQVAKFHNITHLTIHIPENHGADFTRLTYLGFKGEGSIAVRGIVHTTYEAASQVKDHKKTISSKEETRNLLS